MTTRQEIDKALSQVTDPSMTLNRAIILAGGLVAMALDNQRDSLEVALSDIADQLEGNNARPK